MKQRYSVSGMSCASCQMHVEKAVKKVPGVENVSVSLLTNTMIVEGSALAGDVIKSVEKAGYSAKVLGGGTSSNVSEAEKARRIHAVHMDAKDIRGDRAAAKESHGPDVNAGEIDSSREEGYPSPALDREVGRISASGKLAEMEESLKDTETPKLARRLVLSVIVLVILMYFSMGHMMWGFPVPSFLENHVDLGILEMLLSLVILAINRNFFINGFRAMVHGGTNMDTLVAIGSSASFFYSLAALFIMAYAMGNGDESTVMNIAMKHMYFESAAMIPTLITIGKTLEAYSKGRTTDALRSLMRLSPKRAVVIRNGKELEVDIDEVVSGDIFVVKSGENIPVDGVIISGETAVNEAALTGESIPVDKEEGDKVSAATVNLYGYIRCRATRVGEDTTLSQIIRMVADASSTKAPIGRIADRVSAIFVPSVMIIAALTCVCWVIAGKSFSFAFARAVCVLVVSCPCALGLATPVAIMVGNGKGARNGILFKTAAALENTGRTHIIALDKTGTITNGTPVVTDILPYGSVTKETLLNLAGALEKKSEHPLAKAIIEYGTLHSMTFADTDSFTALPGNGLTATLNGVTLYGGNASFIGGRIKIPEDITRQIQSLAQEGKTPLLFARDNHLAGVIAVADTMKEDSPQAIGQLRDLGIETVMLTGDNERTANAVGKAAGVDKVVAGVLPDGKMGVIETLQTNGKVAMVGDGINDAPALTRADTGIAIGAGTDVAIDAADVVIVKSTLTDVAAAIRLSRATIRNIHENLFWAFFYNIICIPLAIGLYQSLFGWNFEMRPVVGAIAMSCSSVTVCLNALRLNLVHIYEGAGGRGGKRKNDTKVSFGNSDAISSSSQNNELDSPVQSDKPDSPVQSDKPDSPAQSADGSEVRNNPEAADKSRDVIQSNAGNNPEMSNNDIASNQLAKNREDTEMTKTMNIDGMMCAHCEARVKKALEAVDGVINADVSHDTGKAIVELSRDVDDAVLKKAVEDQDYAVTSIAS